MSWLFWTAAARIMGSLESTWRCCSSDMAAADMAAAWAAEEAGWPPMGPGPTGCAGPTRCAAPATGWPGMPVPPPAGTWTRSGGEEAG